MLRIARPAWAHAPARTRCVTARGLCWGSYNLPDSGRAPGMLQSRTLAALLRASRGEASGPPADAETDSGCTGIRGSLASVSSSPLGSIRVITARPECPAAPGSGGCEQRERLPLGYRQIKERLYYKIFNNSRACVLAASVTALPLSIAAICSTRSSAVKSRICVPAAESLYTK